MAGLLTNVEIEISTWLMNSVFAKPCGLGPVSVMDIPKLVT